MRTSDARIASLDALAWFRRTTRSPSPGAAGILALFAAPWHGGILHGTDMPFVVPGGEDFSNKVFKLLILARLRDFLAEHGTGLSWHGRRVLGGNGHPILECSWDGKPLKLWFQSSAGLPGSGFVSDKGRSRMGRGVPYIIITAGTGPGMRTVVIDAKN